MTVTPTRYRAGTGVTEAARSQASEGLRSRPLQRPKLGASAGDAKARRQDSGVRMTSMRSREEDTPPAKVNPRPFPKDRPRT